MLTIVLHKSPTILLYRILCSVGMNLPQRSFGDRAILTRPLARAPEPPHRKLIQRAAGHRDQFALSDTRYLSSSVARISSGRPSSEQVNANLYQVDTKS